MSDELHCVRCYEAEETCRRCLRRKIDKLEDLAAWALEAREALEKIRARTDVMNIKGPTEWADKVLAKFPGNKDE